MKRLLFFVYGAAAYLIFLATFLYAIAFVGGFAVPRRLDGPLETSLPAALAIDCALLAIFAVQHSVMARRWFKERWTQIVPWAIERSTYVLCASLALLLLFWQWRPIGVEIWTVDDPIARFVLWTWFAAGWATVLTVTFLINHFDLFGLRQVWLPLIGRPVHPRPVPDAAAVPLRPAPALSRVPARLLDDPDDDRRAPGVRDRHDRLHRAGHSVRRKGSRRRVRRRLRALSPERPDAAADRPQRAGRPSRPMHAPGCRAGLQACQNRRQS